MTPETERKVVVDFGAYGGVGKGVCRYNYIRGSKVVLVGRDEKKLLEMKEFYDVRSSIAIVGDANNSEDVKKVFQVTKEEFGNIDEVWITVGKDGGWEQDTPPNLKIPEDIRKQEAMREKLYPSLLQPIETIVPIVEELFKKQKHGILVHLSSHAAFKTEKELPGNYTYRLLKQEAERLVNSMRRRLKVIPNNKATTINLQPAIIWTPGTAKFLDTPEKRAAAVQPEDIAAWVDEHAHDPRLPERHYFESEVVV